MNRKQEVCRDFQRGNCRFGSRCKYLHTLQQQPQQQRGFAASAFNQPQQRSGYFTGNQQQQQNQVGVKDHKCIDVRLCKEQIRDDFTSERPSFWRLTSYAHWKFLPNDVTGDVSFEELRGYAYEGAKQGMSIQQVAQRESALVAVKNQEFENVLKNYRGPAPATNSVSVSPFLNASASASPFLAAPGNSPMIFGTLSPAVPQQPFQQVPTSSPFKSFGAVQGFMPPFGVPPASGNVSNFPGSSPFGVQSTAVAGSWPSLSANSPFSNPPAANPVHNPFALSQAASPFPSAFNSSSTNNPISSPFTAVPTSGGSQNSASIFRSPLFPSAVPATSPATVQAVGNTAPPVEDKWLASNWSIGQIPEEEPPLHVR